MWGRWWLVYCRGSVQGATTRPFVLVELPDPGGRSLQHVAGPVEVTAQNPLLRSHGGGVAVHLGKPRAVRYIRLGKLYCNNQSNWRQDASQDHSAQDMSALYAALGVQVETCSLKRAHATHVVRYSRAMLESGLRCCHAGRHGDCCL